MVTVFEELDRFVAVKSWQEPGSLASMWDMYQIAAHNLVQTGRTLQALRDGTAAFFRADEVLDDGSATSFVGHLREFKKGCDSLQLVHTSGLADWAIQEYSGKQHMCGQVASTVEHLTVSYQQELSRHFFCFIPPDKASFFRSADAGIADPPFGIETARSFPSAMADIVLAGNCYACGFNDASVFHLMRVLEKGLATLAKALGEPYQYENWHNVIERVESKIRNLDSGCGADWKRKQHFYSEVACEFMFIKDAWRNHVMHGRSEYDETRAANIYSHVRSFMQHLAQGGLAEP